MGNAAQVEATAEVRSQMARHAQALTVAELLRVIQAFNQAATETRSSWQPALPLEIAFIEAIASDNTPSENRSIPVSPPSPSTSSNPPKSKPTTQPEQVKETRPADAAGDEMTPEDATTYQRLDKSWNLVLAQLKSQNPSLNALVNSVKSRSLKGNTSPWA